MLITGTECANSVETTMVCACHVAANQTATALPQAVENWPKCVDPDVKTQQIHAHPQRDTIIRCSGPDGHSGVQASGKFKPSVPKYDWIAGN